MAYKHRGLKYYNTWLVAEQMLLVLRSAVGSLQKQQHAQAQQQQLVVSAIQFSRNRHMQWHSVVILRVYFYPMPTSSHTLTNSNSCSNKGTAQTRSLHQEQPVRTTTKAWTCIFASAVNLTHAESSNWWPKRNRASKLSTAHTRGH